MGDLFRDHRSCHCVFSPSSLCCLPELCNVPASYAQLLHPTAGTDHARGLVRPRLHAQLSLTSYQYRLSKTANADNQRELWLTACRYTTPTESATTKFEAANLGKATNSI